MPTSPKANLKKYKISKLKGFGNKKQKGRGARRREKNDVLLVVGPVTKWRPLHNTPLDWVGNEGLYLILSYHYLGNKKWEWGGLGWESIRATNSPAQVKADYWLRKLKKEGRVIYYTQAATTLETLGKAVRKDYEVRGFN